FFFVMILFLPSLTGYVLRNLGGVSLLIFFQAYCLAVSVWFYFDFRKNYNTVLFRPEFSKYLYATMVCAMAGILFAYSFNFFSELTSLLKIRTGQALFKKIWR